MRMSPAEEQKQNNAIATEVMNTNASDNSNNDSIDSYMDNSAYRGTDPSMSKGNPRAICPISQQSRNPITRSYWKKCTRVYQIA